MDSKRETLSCREFRKKEKKTKERKKERKKYRNDVILSANNKGDNK